MEVRAIRGATTVLEDTEAEIMAAVTEMLQFIMSANPSIKVDDLISIWFTATDDISSAYPAKAARNLGWTNVAMLCAQEMEVAGSLPLCIRVLILCNTHTAQENLRHVYLRNAAQLRPDWAISEFVDKDRGGGI